MLRIHAVNTILYSERFDVCVAFYANLPGFKESMRTDWFVEFQVTDSAFVSVADVNRATIDGAGGNGLTLTFKVDDADATHRLVSQSGARTTQPRNHPWGARTFYVFDPEGRRIEFWSTPASLA